MVECCSTLFNDFKFEELTNADPPNEKGVYVIKVKGKSGVPPNVMIEKTRQLISGIGWDLVTKFIMSRVERLSKIGNCPVIYIGSAGGQRGSQNTLRGRYESFHYAIQLCIRYGFYFTSTGSSNLAGKNLLHPNRKRKS